MPPRKKETRLEKRTGKEETIHGILLDVDYVDQNDHSVIRVWIRSKKGIESFWHPSFLPYFIIQTKTDSFNEEKFLQSTQAVSVTPIKKSIPNTFKVVCQTTEQLKSIRENVLDTKGVIAKYEDDIVFAKRYLMDLGLEPFNGVKIQSNERGEIQQIEREETVYELNALAFDLETYSPGRFSNAKKDPILTISIVTKKESLVITHHPKAKGIKGCKQFENEKEMLEFFLQYVKETDPDVLVTYNGDSFDLPYIRERCQLHKLVCALNADGSEFVMARRGMDSAAKIIGRQHLDVFQLMSFLARFQVINLIKYDLESVAHALLGKEKDKLTWLDINKIWETGVGFPELVRYNREDSEATMELAKKYWPICMQTCKISHQTLYDASRLTGGMLVEWILIQKAFEQGVIVPNKPAEGEVMGRRDNPIEGAFVKTPTAGLHENLCVMDFRSLYPSIMISHNVSPETLDPADEPEAKKKNASPSGHYFSIKRKGFIAQNMEKILEQRSEIKARMKAAKGSKMYDLLHAESFSLKIALNSFYGYLLFGRSRWYSRECGESITAWAREYIQMVGNKAQDAGFELLYQDTDSAFIKIPNGKTQKDALHFMEKTNNELPKPMELELEGFYKRGIFVTQKGSEKAAKKRYALLGEDGQLKIVGFEYVRRDWSTIAKETQKSVIQAVLSEGKPEKAVKIARDAIARLKSGAVPKKELVVYTQLTKPIEKYETTGPHVEAARKAREKGIKIETGSVIAFIVTKKGNSISEKATMEDFVSEGDYDADYYILHQVVPAVIHILRELGYSEEDLISGGQQKKLF